MSLVVAQFSRPESSPNTKFTKTFNRMSSAVVFINSEPNWVYMC